jgi:hypothetical protein
MRNEPNSRMADGDQAIVELIELVAALDRRVPHVERAGEIQIAREAAALRKTASARIEHLTTGSNAAREAEQSNAVMSDDGGPPPLHSRRSA